MRGRYVFVGVVLATGAGGRADAIALEGMERRAPAARAARWASPAAWLGFEGSGIAWWKEPGDIGMNDALGNGVFGLASLEPGTGSGSGGAARSELMHAVHSAMGVEHEMDLALGDAGEMGPLFGTLNGAREPGREESVLLAPLPQSVWIGAAGLAGAGVIAWAQRRGRRTKDIPNV